MWKDKVFHNHFYVLFCPAFPDIRKCIFEAHMLRPLVLLIKVVLKLQSLWIIGGMWYWQKEVEILGKRTCPSAILSIINII
jgi:hypothetical protein